MKQLTAKEVETLLVEGKPLNLIDVWEVEEVETGIIPGAIHIPLGSVELRMQELNKYEEGWLKWKMIIKIVKKVAEELTIRIHGHMFHLYDLEFLFGSW